MNKRLNIALLVGDIRDMYSNSITKGAMRAARESDCNILIVPGRYYHARKELLYEEYEYQYQTLFSYFKENNVDLVIACTSVVGIVSGSISRNSLDSFIHGIEGIPVITVSGDSDDITNICYDNVTGIKEGMDVMIGKQMCTKIAMVAGPKNNLDSIERVNAYKESLIEHGMSVEENLIIHCDFTERCTNDIVNLFKSCKGINGVVFANDRMAVGGYEAMRILDLKVGRDVSFIGFDNAEMDINLDPPLASVAADPENLGYESVLLGIDYLKSGEVENRIIPTRFIMRDSVLLGNKKSAAERPFDFDLDKNTDFDTFAKKTFLYIYNPTVNYGRREKIYRAYLYFILEIEKLYKNEEVNDEILASLSKCFNKLFSEDEYNEIDIGKMTILLEMIKEVIIDDAKTKEKRNFIVYISAYVYRRLAAILSLRENETNYRLKKLQHEVYRISADMIGFDNITDETYASIISDFHKIEINHSFLYVFKNPIKHDIEDTFQTEEFIYLKAVQDGDKVFSPSAREQMVPVSEMFENAFSYINGNSHLIMLNLYVRNYIYGVLLCDVPYDMFAFYESLIYQVSSAIRILHLLLEKEETDKQLKESIEIITKNNIELDILAKSDDLTGIYNRRGFLYETEKLLKSKPDKKYFVVGFADTDGLKKINDTFGHDEGDCIIMTTAKIISETMGDKGVFGRLGGDEFAVAFFTDDPEADKAMIKEFNEKIEEYNVKSLKDYKLSVSFGFFVHEHLEDMDLNKLLDAADKEMYHIKKNRKKRF